MKILVTGAGGFVGRHLLEHLAACGDRVVAADRSVIIAPAAQSITLDVADARATDDLLAAWPVDAVIHLAAIAFVPEAEEDPSRTIAINAGGAANVLRAIARHCPRARFLLISSAEVYGAADPANLPTTEAAPLAPANGYAASKLLAEVFTRYAAARHQLDVLIARPFTHLGPGQSPQFAISSFARQLAEIATGRAEPVLRVGNLAARRDICDARDVVAAYRLALLKMPAGAIFNICRGVDFSMGELLDALIEQSGVRAEVRVDPARLRPVDIPVIRGAADYFMGVTGWRPQIELRQTLRDLYDYWTAHFEGVAG